ncbi:MAG: hypothetical protein ACI39H_00100 [Lachnospiraceae bacterium]
MSEKVRAIEIVFENLDYVFIPQEHLGAVSLDDISVSIGRVAMNAVLKRTIAKSVYLQIMNTFQCDGMKHDSFSDIYENFDKRIYENDITYLRIHYENELYEDILVPWQDRKDNKYKNCLQKTEQDEEGNIIVRIG